MTDIFVTGNKSDREIENLIRTRLTESYSITYINDNEITETGCGYKLLVLDSERPHINVCSGILLMKENGEVPDNLPESITAIINMDNPLQIKAIQQSGVRAVTCGAGSMATVSFSSETEDTLVVSLNRSITALSGKIIQPLEVPVRKQEAEKYSLMSYMALRLILDDYDSELGQLI